MRKTKQTEHILKNFHDGINSAVPHISFKPEGGQKLDRDLVFIPPEFYIERKKYSSVQCA